MGLDSTAPKKIEISTPNATEMSPSTRTPEVHSANNNQPVSLGERAREYALNKVGSMRDGGAIKEKLAGLVWNKINHEKAWEKISTMPDGRTKEWWANYASKQYGREINIAQATVDEANAQMKALSPSEGARIQELFKKQDDAIGQITDLSDRRSKYASLLQATYDKRLGNIEDPKSPRGRINDLEAAQNAKSIEIQRLQGALDEAKKKLTDFTRDHTEKIAQHSYGDATAREQSMQALARFVQAVSQNEQSLSAMVSERDNAVAKLTQLRNMYQPIENKLQQWKKVAENGSVGTNAMERARAPQEKTTRMSVAEAKEEISTIADSLTVTEVSGTESGEDWNNPLARAALILLQRLALKEKTGILRVGLKDRLEKIFNSSELKNAIPTEALINFWNSYADDEPKTKRIDKQTASEILKVGKILTLEGFGVAVSNTEEFKNEEHEKIFGGMEKVARALTSVYNKP